MDKFRQDTTITQAVASEAIEEAHSKGLRQVNASGTYKSEKLTLSLVHQANVALFMPVDESNHTFTLYVFAAWLQGQY